MAQLLNWGILATGAIAKSFADHLPKSDGGRLVAVGSRSLETARAFARPHGADVRAHGSYEALLADPGVQAVYIGTPHPLHARLAILACRAGKHVLCEKPLGINAAEVMAILEAARANDVFLMEAFMYRCHPQTKRLVELLRAGTIGEVRAIQAAFSFHWPVERSAADDAKSRLLANDLAGGGILDVGGYPVSLARLVAGVAAGRDFLDPVEVKGVGRLGSTGVDEWTSAVLKFENGIVAEVATGVQVNQENVARIYGSDGWIELPTPWVPAREGGTSKILIHRPKAEQPETIEIAAKPIYAVEADAFAEFVASRQAKSPAMSGADSLGNARTLDRWRESIGLVYESEKPGMIATVSGEPLRVNAKNTMKYGAIAGVAKPMSRLVMGCDNQPNLPHAAVLWDDFFQRGGNAFDTAFVYTAGLQEKLLGDWMKTRGVRRDVVVIAKGAHSPYCFPATLTVQLHQSLERLQTDHADLYIMHRDNPDVPVGEFVEVLNEHLRARRIHAFGGSNWSIDRIRAGNEYARARGLTGFATLSNNFSLARMVDAVWPGCIAATDEASKKYLTEAQLPLLAWSSQARGFFLEGKAAPGNHADEELSRCWYAPDNFQRLERANELARRKGVRPIQVALAYVLHQPFPTFALIGPRTLEETRTSFEGLGVQLTEAEVRWLNLDT